jgi:hypothetical protein
MQQLRTDLWVAAFLRRHNDLGRICVVMRRGDPIAGQVWIELDHLDGTRSLYSPAALGAGREGALDRQFQRRFDHASPVGIAARLAREADFDPDYWLLSLEMRGGDPGIEVVG